MPHSPKCGAAPEGRGAYVCLSSAEDTLMTGVLPVHAYCVVVGVTPRVEVKYALCATMRSSSSLSVSAQAASASVIYTLVRERVIHDTIDTDAQELHICGALARICVPPEVE